jgi:hypothetical protein
MGLKRIAAAVMLAVLPCCAFALQQTSYDAVTSTQAVAAREHLNKLKDTVAPDGTNTEVYSAEQLNRIIEDRVLFSTVRDHDRCQFTPDIEDRARLVKIPVFMFAWGDMLVNGVCVTKDQDLGLEYMKRAAESAYAPALERLAFYYERGYFLPRNRQLSERYMHTSAVLGSKTGRLGWADMLVRGFGTPSMYEEAYSWLYHSTYTDEYSRLKQKYLEEELQKRMPPNVVARDQEFAYDY